MRIVQYMPRLRLADGGVVRAVLDLCTLLASRGHAVTLFSNDAPDAPASWKGEPAPGNGGRPRLIEIPRPTRPMGLYSAAALDAIAPAIRAADILHLHTPWEPSNTQLASVARSARKPYIVTIHGMLDDWCMAQKGLKKRIYLRLAGRSLLERAARVHCTAEAERDQASRWYPRGRSVVIPYAFDLADFRALAGADEARARFPALAAPVPRVLFLSRLHVKKGVHVAIDALAELRARSSDAHLFIAGTGDEAYAASLRAQVERLDLGGRAHFLGLVTGSLKLSVYQAADVFILPTSQENFGLVLPEAMACRTPPITTRGVDIWPEIERCGGGVIAEATARGFADAIVSLLGDAGRRKEMGDRGRAWVFEHLDSAKVVERFEALYAECAGE